MTLSAINESKLFFSGEIQTIKRKFFMQFRDTISILVRLRTLLWRCYKPVCFTDTVLVVFRLFYQFSMACKRLRVWFCTHPEMTFYDGD